MLPLGQPRLDGVGLDDRAVRPGHFFFEAERYDHINHATTNTRRDQEMGYNCSRRIVETIWAIRRWCCPSNPTLSRISKPGATHADFIRQTAKLARGWGIAGAVRTVHLFFIRGSADGLVWMTKILDRPVQRIRFYWKGHSIGCAAN